MGQLDRDWYKEHHQKKALNKTLDNDPRETTYHHHDSSKFKFTFLHFILLSIFLFTLIIWYFQK